MKVNGVSADKETAIFGPLTLKRGDKFLAFYAQPIWDLNEFNALCPPPENKNYRFTKNGKEKDPDAPAYREALGKYAAKRWGYTILKSLEPSNIEFETASISDPSTWDKVEAELKSFLGFYEFAKLMNLVDEANAIDEAKLEENSQSFFLQQAASAEPPKNSQKDEAASS